MVKAAFSRVLVKVMDGRDLSELEEGSFDAVIDKGMTDSIMHNDKFTKMIAEVRSSNHSRRFLQKTVVYVLAMTTVRRTRTPVSVQVHVRLS